MECNDGLHGALCRDYRGRWFCLLCKEEIDDYNALETKRQEAREAKAKAKKPEDKDDSS